LRLIQSIRNKMERLHYPIVRDARSFKRDWNRSPEGQVRCNWERNGPKHAAPFGLQQGKRYWRTDSGGVIEVQCPAKAMSGYQRPVETSGSIGFGLHGRFWAWPRDTAMDPGSSYASAPRHNHWI